MINGVPIGKIQFSPRIRENKGFYKFDNSNQRTTNKSEQKQEKKITNEPIKEEEDIER